METGGLETKGWRWAQSRANPSLVYWQAISLFSRENTGKFYEFNAYFLHAFPEKLGGSVAFGLYLFKAPLKRTGNFINGTGI